MGSGRQRGFSLTEVLVAFAILSLCLPVVLAIFSSGLRASSRAADYHVATRLADAKLTELGAATENGNALAASGSFAERYRWRGSVRTPQWWSPPETAPHPFTPYEISVEVTWSELGRERSVSLTTLRLAPAR